MANFLRDVGFPRFARYKRIIVILVFLRGKTYGKRQYAGRRMPARNFRYRHTMHLSKLSHFTKSESNFRAIFTYGPMLPSTW